MTVKISSGNSTNLTVRSGDAKQASIVVEESSVVKLQTGSRESVVIKPVEGPGFLRIQPKSGDSIVLRTNSAGGGTSTFDSSYAAERDSQDKNILYKGKPSASDAAQTDAVWQIQRKNLSTGEITYADGDELYDNMFSDRENKAYS